MKHESKATVVTDGAFGKSLDELAELRRYRDKTEAALLEMTAFVGMFKNPDQIAARQIGEMMRSRGLWREPPKDGVA